LSLSSSTASASPDQMVSSPKPLIHSSVSSPTTISLSDNSISVQTGHPMITRAKFGIFKPHFYTAITISTTILLHQVISNTS